MDDFLKQLHQIRAYCNAWQQALPALENAGKTLTGRARVQAVESIEREYGLADLDK
jgi:hypothetical protein